MSQGAVMFVFISEVFPNAVRARARPWARSSIGRWRPTVTWSFPMVAKSFVAGAFGFFAADDGGAILLRLADHARDEGRRLEDVGQR